MHTRLIFALTIPLFILSAFAQEKRFTQPNSAMEPTVLEGEKFSVDTNAYQNSVPARGDVVVLRHEDILVLKRIIAVAGDSIEGQDFRIILNGTPVHEGYVEHKGQGAIAPESSFLKAFERITIAPGHIFVV